MLPSISSVDWRHGFILLTLLSALAAAVPGEASALKVVDNKGRTVSLAAPARRIVSLAPHTTELLYSAGAGEWLVAAVSYSDYPEAANALPRVGSYDRIDLERVLALEPDLIVGWPSGNPDAALDFLTHHSIPVFFSEPLSFAQIAENIRSLGTLVGRDRVADAAASAFEQRMAEVQQRYQGAPPVQVFYQVWQDPLMTISADHIISKVMGLCGGQNLFPHLPRLASSIALEAVLAADPEAIVIPASNAQWQQNWQRWPQLRAVRDQRILIVNPDLLSRPTARIADGAEELCSQLQAGAS